MKVVAAVDTSVSARMQKVLLEDSGVFVDSVIALSFRSSDIYGVPTVILSDSEAEIRGLWFGLLDDEEEMSIIC